MHLFYRGVFLCKLKEGFTQMTKQEIWLMKIIMVGQNMNLHPNIAKEVGLKA